MSHLAYVKSNAYIREYVKKYLLLGWHVEPPLTQYLGT